MFTIYLALISESAKVEFADVTQIAAAIQKQITRDFSPVWNIPATIDTFSRLEDVPPDYWPIIIRDDIGVDAAGIHLDSNGQPYALVVASNATAITVSHEVLEMLVDPFGDRFIASQSIKPDRERVNYLVEACDPCEGEQFGYRINGILVSDFYTPNYFDPVFSPAVRYSFTGAITQPRQVLKDGYISWRIPETGEWWQGIFTSNELVFQSLGILRKTDNMSWRQIIDKTTKAPLKKLMKRNEIIDKPLAETMMASALRDVSVGWAAQLREDIKLAIGK